MAHKHVGYARDKKLKGPKATQVYKKIMIINKFRYVF